MTDKTNPSWLICVFYLVVMGLLKPVSAQDTFQCNYTTNIDRDDDGLIEICDLDAFNAIRYQLDGSGYRETSNAVKITAGCPSRGCDGYELRSDLDFNTDDSYRDTTNKEVWTSGLGWLPIGNQLNFFTARFEGNDHTISNLYINRPSDYIGLFRATAKLAKISGLVLSQTNIDGNSYVGSLAGHAAGIVIGDGSCSGGLVGSNKGIISGSFVNGRVVASGEHTVGLIGWSYAHQTMHTTVVRVINNYWDSEATEVLLSAGGSLRTAAQLSS